MTSRTRIAIAAAIATALGTLSLLPSFQDFSWTVPTIGGVLVVFGVAEIARLIGAPLPIASLVSIAGFAAYVTAVFGDGTAVAGFLPGAAARAHLHHLAHQGMRDINHLEAPVPANHGLVLLTVVGVGLVAICIDLIASALRRPALAGLPLLALYAVPAATTRHGVGTWPFVLAASGFLVLLLTESNERVHRWGRALGAGWRHPQAGLAADPKRADTSALTNVGRRVGVAALGIAVLVPAAVPGLHPGLFGAHGGPGRGHGHGPSTVTTYNPITRIRRQLIREVPQPLFTYTTDTTTPAYLRMTVLDQFDGTSWSQSDLSAPSSQAVSRVALPTPTGLANSLVATTRQVTQIAARSNFDVPWLPVPYSPESVSVTGDWRYDDPSRAIFSTQTTTQGLSWSVTSTIVKPTVAQVEAASAAPTDPDILADAKVNRALLPEVLVRDARQVTRGASTPYEQAIDLQNWFQSSRFRYSLDVNDSDGTNAIAAFLHQRTGYCVQFASTMALMARFLHIPARLAIGFTPGEAKKDGTYVVTTKDAHIWPELYFTGIGWLSFEPTPRTDISPPTYTTGGGPSKGGGGASQQQQGPGGKAKKNKKPDSAQLKIDRLDRPAGGAAAGPTGQPRKAAPAGGGVNWLLVLLIVAGVGAVLPSTGRALTRRRRWGRAESPAALATAGWLEVGDDVVDHGLPWYAGDSPRRGATRLITVSEMSAQGREALHRIVQLVEHARYAPTSTALSDVADAAQVRANVDAVRAALASTVERRQRWIARLFPPSTTKRARRWMSDVVADALDYIDVTVDTISRTLRTAVSKPFARAGASIRRRPRARST
jgi:transglutaminase-like putative cysteine protease